MSAKASKAGQLACGTSSFFFPEFGKFKEILKIIHKNNAESTIVYCLGRFEDVQ